MARNSEQLREAIEREERIIAESKSELTRGYARERLSYWRGELALQKAKEEREAEEKAIQVVEDGKWCVKCGQRMARVGDPPYPTLCAWCVAKEEQGDRERSPLWWVDKEWKEVWNRYKVEREASKK